MEGTTNFTHRDQFTCDEEYYSTGENSCIMSSVVLENLSKVWKMIHDDVDSS